ncbi:MAG TPA: hypothetical protein VIU11_25605 [Nakamurella sp.]
MRPRPGPVLGGLLTTVDRRLTAIVNVPAGAAALLLLRPSAPSPNRPLPFDWNGGPAPAGAVPSG